MSAVEDPGLEAHWRRVRDAWDDEAAHDAFLEVAAETDRLAAAAARYRDLASDSVLGARAQQRMATIGVLAVARLEASRTQQPQVRFAATAMAVAVLLVAAALAVLATILLRA